MRLPSEVGIDAAFIPEHPETLLPSPEVDVSESRHLALRVAEIISDTPAADTVVLDIHRLSTIADFFTICFSADYA